MLIHLIKSICKQIDQGEYNEHKKESVIYILYVSRYGVNCKGDFSKILSEVKLLHGPPEW